MSRVTSRDGNGLPDRRITYIFQDLDCCKSSTVLENGQGYLFLDDVDCHLHSRLWQLLMESIFYLGCTVGAADARNLEGIHLGLIYLRVLGHNKRGF